MIFAWFSRQNRAALLLFIGAIAFNLLAVAAATWFLIESRSNYEAAAAASTQTIARILQRSIASDVDRIDLTLGVVADALEHQRPAGASPDFGALGPFIAREQAHLMTGSSIGVSDSSGRLLFDIPRRQQAADNWAARDFFRHLAAAAHAQLWVGNPTPGSPAQGPVIVFARRYDNSGGGFAGVVAVAVPVRHFHKLLEQASVGPQGIVLLRDADNAVITRFPASSNPEEQMGARRFSPQLHQAMASGRPSLTFFAARTGDGIARIDTYRRLSAVPFSLVVGRAQSDILAPWRRQLAWVLGFLGAFLVVTLLGAHRLWREMKTSGLAGSQAQSLLRNASDGLHVLDHSGHLVFVSDEFCSMLGYSRQELLGRHASFWDADLPPRELDAKVAAQFESASRTQFETHHRRKDGTVFPVEVSGKPLDILGRRLLFNSSRDITERRTAQQRIDQAIEALRESQEIAAMGSYVLDLQRGTWEGSDMLDRLLGIDSRHDHTIQGWAALVAPEDRVMMAEYLAHEVLEQGRPFDREYRIIRPIDGALRWVHGLGRLSLDASGRPLQMLGTVQDITARREAESKAEHLARFDALTDLPNRTLLYDRLAHAMSASERDQEYCALLFVDLDHFKKVNDTIGHQAGDQLLVEAARRMRQAVRASDTVARFGGDEFVLVLEGLGREPLQAGAHARRVADKVLAGISGHYELGGQTFYCTVSIGATLFRGSADSVETVLRHADLAMYRTKQGGRNAVSFFETSMQVELAQRTALESELRAALRNHEFVLYFQPQFDRAGALTGAEALLRWNHPSRGLLLPGEFISLAEETGIIVPLGQWVLDAACARLAAWAGAAATRELVLAINASARQFAQADFVQCVLTSLRQAGAAPSRLKIELTESTVLDNLRDGFDKMQALKASGISFALDDFGTGSSSLSYLTRLPLDQLKIDKSFVDDLPADPQDAMVAQTIIAMGKGLGLNVLAEGVETPAQWAFLMQHGCDAFQGYHFGKPMPVEAFEALPGRLARKHGATAPQP
jgi:diguanylate cyclase (GGDEF)-like protein/PAS domain S-box-containing protein